MTTDEMDGIKESEKPIMLVGICRGCEKLNEWEKDDRMLQSDRPCSFCGMHKIEPRSVTTKRTYVEKRKR